MLICEGWVLLGLRPLYQCHPDSSGPQASDSQSINSPPLPPALEPRSHWPGTATATATGEAFPFRAQSKSLLGRWVWQHLHSLISSQNADSSKYIQRNEWPN